MYPGWCDGCNGSPVVAHTADRFDKLRTKGDSKLPFMVSRTNRVPFHRKPFDKPSSHKKLPHPAPQKRRAAQVAQDDI